ncbi:flavodoxin-dependent (E)-4-hydroxy-3-methylbut-2-enyl-diphosphate synthase [Anaerococcus hydrogenalis]|uniref:4-hydroxy-3-methylbut-2-en-1-yl diphosphate synthase (flavodoxin) n=1 Tax=Anaerococcus hydrogenalis TaxID=33029 RepID=A0A2N6UKI0_9FIRM|nr:flavodoxin-dependent (E)-4-hydroxy-3-methylbut-2-enyl-diphosphate synthase [Anaerococcus hydrogenalis]MDK7694231.1 flavodoxin-dependent (E)-4-hydroxy-3-methylbut-2-enyl-diphosphate synthase [Anaerococcus hydrogenalis]MDK7696009.1 flavodoxin-dependent (E)-4-hydroxy-3-methylbut-2-enyl-diphosphate synthase [Anaerococcus hydrogenalis]MDK7707258.1 flavodoxin-dependent (E)-4-hydroxy-3-methylbut-2-enyl-diphosphate synthase [Anaerococcus hydrogenalis]PMC82284.1 4-hydroxy-3-methylbut-2-en-1-yl diphos
MKKTRKVYVGDVAIGGGSPISIQSMTTKETKNIKEVVKQINDFEKAGCDISRSAINSLEDARAISEIKKRTNLPFVADIQFDYKLAISAVENGCDCLRINPGNIGGADKVKILVEKCKEKNIPIRIGVNSGSVHKDMIEKYHGVNVDSLVYSALEEVKVLEDLDFHDIVISIKSSDVNTMIDVNRKISSLCDYPLHLGVTEAGPLYQALVKSSIGMGSLLKDGIGDTIRVSITGDPLQEVKAGKTILKSLGLRRDGIDLVSCPTCSRTSVNLDEIVNEASDRLDKLNLNLKVAIMGCPVNGPGEAKEADYGIACAKGYGFLFKKGITIKKVKQEEIVDSLIEEILKDEKNEN